VKEEDYSNLPPLEETDIALQVFVRCLLERNRALFKKIDDVK